MPSLGLRPGPVNKKQARSKAPASGACQGHCTQFQLVRAHLTLELWAKRLRFSMSLAKPSV